MVEQQITQTQEINKKLYELTKRVAELEKKELYRTQTEDYK